MPWYSPLAEVLRAAFSLPVQLACSLLVLQIFLRKQYRWFGYAVGWHSLANMPLFLSNDIYLPLPFLAVFAAGSVWIILRLNQPQSDELQGPSIIST
jgi:uncharacterized membrane protein YhfC